MGVNIPSNLPEIVKLVPHHQQVTSWDCGLACTSMVLTALGSRKYSPVELSNVIGVTSIWTIDVAYLLKRYGVEDFTYYTSYIGVNWDNVKSPIYNGDGTLQDAGVRVVQMMLKLDDLRRFLRSERFVAIVLVNLNYAQCSRNAIVVDSRFCMDGGGGLDGVITTHHLRHRRSSRSRWTKQAGELAQREGRPNPAGISGDRPRFRNLPISERPMRNARPLDRATKKRNKDPTQSSSPIPPPNPLFSSPVPIPSLSTIAQEGQPGQRFRYRSLREMLFHMQPDRRGASRSVPSSPIPSFVSHSHARRRRMNVEERLLERDEMSEFDEDVTGGEEANEGGYVSEIQPAATGGEDEIRPDHAKAIFERWYDIGTRVVDAVILGPQMMVSGTVGMCARCGVGRDRESVSSSSSVDDAEFSSLFCCGSKRRRKTKAKGLGVRMPASVGREEGRCEKRWIWNAGNMYESGLPGMRDVLLKPAGWFRRWVGAAGVKRGKRRFACGRGNRADLVVVAFVSQLLNTSAPSTRTLDELSGGWDAEAQTGTATTVSEEDESWADAAEPPQRLALWSALRWSIAQLFESHPVPDLRVQVEGSDMTEASGFHTPPLAVDLDVAVDAGWDGPVETISYPVMQIPEASTSSRRPSWFAGSSAQSKETVVGWKCTGSVSRGGSPLRRMERERSSSGSGSVSSGEVATEHKFHFQRAHSEQQKQGSSPSKRGIGNAGRGQGPGGMHRRNYTPPSAMGGEKDEEFVGHYVFLVGYDPEEDVFLYREPGTTAELCAMSTDDMEKARCASGTDHDCIVIRVR
ncbi:Guanylylate cyclase-domain-containing protein [Cladochytrium replicatum]|nr:Guanylylate cyclase-domain-containing protein [Cladochytrium replicatum]